MRGPSDKPSLRLFVAAPLWGAFREEALPRYEALRRQGWPVKWVRPENWHITLKFLGEIPSSKLEALKASLEAAVKDAPPFRMVLEGLGGFPRLSRARVLWVGVGEGRQSLVELAAKVHRACVEAGCPGDRKGFQAHLTLARAKAEPVSVRVSPDLYRAVWGALLVESIHLVKSVLAPGGSVYESVGEFFLKGRES